MVPSQTNCLQLVGSTKMNDECVCVCVHTKTSDLDRCTIPASVYIEYPTHISEREYDKQQKDRTGALIAQYHSESTKATAW